MGMNEELILRIYVFYICILIWMDHYQTLLLQLDYNGTRMKVKWIIKKIYHPVNLEIFIKFLIDQPRITGFFINFPNILFSPLLEHMFSIMVYMYPVCAVDQTAPQLLEVITTSVIEVWRLMRKLSRKSKKNHKKKLLPHRPNN